MSLGKPNNYCCLNNVILLKLNVLSIILANNYIYHKVIVISFGGRVNRRMFLFPRFLLTFSRKADRVEENISIFINDIYFEM